MEAEPGREIAVPEKVGNRLRIPEGKKLEIIHSYLLDDLKMSDLAEKFDMSRSAMSNFIRRNRRQIEEYQRGLTEGIQGLWIKNLDARMAEYMHDAELLKGKRSPAAVRARTAIFKQVAEELGQMPGRTNLVVVPVQHIIEGVNMDDLQ